VISLAGFTRRRKALAAAVLPYLLLSLFVDFVHLHRLFNGPVTVSSTAVHLHAADQAAPKLPDGPCAICQWQRAGTGMQTIVSAQQTLALVTTAFVIRSTAPPTRPDLGSPDFRGPPSPLSL